MSLPIPVPDDELLLSAPDLFSRHYRVFLAIERMRAVGEHFRILDVGGRAGLTKRFFPADEVTIVDIRSDQDDVIAVAPGEPLPFEADSFDFVVSFDVLEHVEPDFRGSWLREALRVAAITAYVTVPDDNPSSSRAERAADALYRRLTGESHPWLREHAELGVPRRDDIEAVLRSMGATWVRSSSNPIDRWFEALAVGFVRDYGRDVLENPESVTEVNRTFIGGDETEPGYRSIYAIAKSGDRGTSELLLARPSSVPPSPLELGLVDLHTIERMLRRDRDEARAKVERCSGKLLALQDENVGLRDANSELRNATSELRATVETLHSLIDDLRMDLEKLRGRWTYRAGRRFRRLLGRTE